MPGVSSETNTKTPSISHVCVMGGSGFLGAALVESLQRTGVTVTTYTRASPSAGQAHWSPMAGDIDTGPLEEADVVVNLAGENLASGRWDAVRKQGFIDSRVRVTALLSRCLAELKSPPELLINASAVGFYGDRGEHAVSEESAAGGGFLADLCQAWEGATSVAGEVGIRVALPRFGVILGRDGGALRKLLPIFRIGLGGRLGSGQQYMPWIAMADAVGVMRFIIKEPELAGPINAVAPEPCTNAQFTAALAHALSRPALLPAPAFVLRTVLGEMAQEMLLSGANARPRVLERVGYRFEYPRLEDALRHLV